MLSAFKNFGVTFLISAVLFGLLAYFAAGFVTGTMSNIMTKEEDELSEIMQNPNAQTPIDAESDSAESTPTVPSTDEKVPDGESFNFLVVTTDYRPDLYENYQPTLEHMNSVADWYSVSAADTRGCLSEDYRTVRATSILLVRADKENRAYTYTYFSPETQVYTQSGYHTLGDVYTYYGTQKIVDHVHAMTGVDVDYTLLLNAYHLDELTELCGTPTIPLTVNLYQDANLAYTTQAGATVEHIGDDGSPWTENVSNTLVLSAGDVLLDAATFDILNAFREQSAADVSAKEAWTVAIAKAYINALLPLDYAQMKILLTQLITAESAWGTIEGLKLPENVEPEVPEEPVEPEEPDAPSEDTEEPYNPWEDTGAEDDNDLPLMDGQTDEEGEDDENPEETINKIWLIGLTEPDRPIFETDFTMAEFEKIYEVLCAAEYFESLTVTYPTEYVPATDDREAYVDPDLNKGLTNFLQYRK